MKQCREYIPLVPVGSSTSAAQVALVEYIPRIALGNVLDEVNPKNHTQELFITSGFQLVTGYDNFTLSSSLTGFVVKCLYGSETATTDRLTGDAAIIFLILGWRLLGGVLNAVDQNMQENARHEKEMKRVEKVIQRHRDMLADLSKKDQGATEGKKIKDKWSAFNILNFKRAIDVYATDQILSDYHKHRVYLAFRSALGNNATTCELQALSNFMEFNTKSTRDKLIHVVENALKSKIKPAPIADKDTRFVARVLKSMGNFILANCTGMSLVTIMASFIAAAAIPGLIVSMPLVYISAIGVGLLYAFFKVANEVKERHHSKIAQKFNQEKVRYKQHQAIQNLLSPVKLLDVNDAEMNTVKMENYDPEDVMQEVPLTIRGFFASRVFFSLPLSIAVGSVTGWWAVIIVAGIVAGLFGSAGLVGAAAVIFPAVAAAVVTLFYIAKSLDSLYQEYQLEKEKIRQVNANLALQKSQARLSSSLRTVNRLSRGELLEEYIRRFLKKEKSDDKELKRSFHLIEKMLGVKKSEAADDNAFYGYLASEIMDNEPDNKRGFIGKIILGTPSLMDDNTDSLDVEKKKLRALALAKQLRDHINGSVDNDPLQYTTEFVKKSKTKREIFSEYIVGYGFSLTLPIVVGLSVAVAFATGPAFIFIGIGMAVLLCITTYVSSVMNQHREDRMKDYELKSAQIDMRDKVVEFKLPVKVSLGAQEHKTSGAPDALNLPLIEPIIYEPPRSGSPTTSVVREGVGLTLEDSGVTIDKRNTVGEHIAFFSVSNAYSALRSVSSENSPPITSMHPDSFIKGSFPEAA
jgi:hypothetical protein